MARDLLSIARDLSTLDQTGEMPRTPYEAPQLRELGTVQELTEWCFWGKNLGSPDYFDHIPIHTCSS